MSESPLMIKSKAFVLEVIRACKVVWDTKCEGATIHQFLRSGANIGANIREAFYAHGKADFITKSLSIKSSSQYSVSEHSLRAISGYYYDKSILDRCVEVKRILIASINTAKEGAE